MTTEHTEPASHNADWVHESDHDKLTGLLTREGFLAALDKTLVQRRHGNSASVGAREAVDDGGESDVARSSAGNEPSLRPVSSASEDASLGGIAYFDVSRFKAVNTRFGVEEGDRFLRFISANLAGVVGEEGLSCRVAADRFAFWLPESQTQLVSDVEELLSLIADFDLPVNALCNAGICMLAPGMDAPTALDCAIIAQNDVKGRYDEHVRLYSDDLRLTLLDEQEIAWVMRESLDSGHFIVYYQPQYSHSTGMVVGAEALVRWLHPEKGLVAPDRFIPVFERNGFVSRLDLYVFETVCRFQRRLLDEGVTVVPVSVNLSRKDIFGPDFLEALEDIRNRYQVPAKYLRVEITESSAFSGAGPVNEALAQLHSYGFLVEMDDFGSGYSSLNVLKDIDFDVVKLDMRFFENEGGCAESRGGIILSSVIHMLEWLGLPVIAEGVETPEQADFLRSVGCDTIQGYLYAPPVTEQEFVRLLSQGSSEPPKVQLNLLEEMDATRFWSVNSLETLIFSNYVGGSCIFEYDGAHTDILRVNQKYLTELGMNLSVKELCTHDMLDAFDEQNRALYLETVRRAIETGEEEEVETWRTLVSDCCGEERVCIRTNLRVLGRSGNRYIMYAMVRNVTAERRLQASDADVKRRFMAAAEQANIYFWEYTVATHEMRPCFRCMRDLGFPALLKNYPESAIDMGVFPPDVADEYRDWHRRIAEGEPSLEGIFPLTVGRVPFHVRYTTEFDESGRPVKAYGSATLVVD